MKKSTVSSYSDIEKNEAFKKMKCRWGKINKKYNTHKTHTPTGRKPKR